MKIIIISVFKRMTQLKRQNGKIRTTQIPLSIQVNPNIGIVNFQSEPYRTVLEKPQIKVSLHQQQITNKSAIGRESDSDDQDQEYSRKRIISTNRVTIRPQNIKKKYFRVDIPVQKPGYGLRNYKQKMNFIIEFTNESQGSLIIVDNVFDSQVEITNDKQLPAEERIRLQEQKMDARRRQEKIQVVDKEEKKDNRKKEK